LRMPIWRDLTARLVPTSILRLWTFEAESSRTIIFRLLQTKRIRETTSSWKSWYRSSRKRVQTRASRRVFAVSKSLAGQVATFSSEVMCLGLARRIHGTCLNKRRWRKRSMSMEPNLYGADSKVLASHQTACERSQRSLDNVLISNLTSQLKAELRSYDFG